ncbi:hypothetical protein L486_00389 [Kwoniella mangroviensis CBS 10435]|uniref:Uncharacterized protein n=1 Tax=Kwoniella mangroviensis CBS 10435 TaxID=1331196 RepID=A0A1B9IYY8_9TREE|nr:hypothetical protein L486_00389 [Kwoniella mangroviensis CBS 10435]
MAESSGRSEVPTVPIAELYDAIPYNDGRSTGSESRAMKHFLNQHGDTKIGRRTLGAIISEVKQITAPGRAYFNIDRFHQNSSLSVLLTGQTQYSNGNAADQRFRVHGPALTSASTVKDRDALRTVLLMQALSHGPNDPNSTRERPLQRLTRESATALISGCDRASSRHGTVSENFERAKPAISSAMESQDETGSFNLNLEQTPMLKELPGIPVFIPDRKVRKRLKSNLNASQRAGTISAFSVTREYLGADYEVIKNGLEKLQDTVLRSDTQRDPDGIMSYLAQRGFTSAATDLYKNSERDKRCAEWSFNLILAQAATGKKLPTNREADMMSDDYMDEWNATLSPSTKYTKSTDRIWPKPSEFLTVNDQDVQSFFDDVARTQEAKSKASLDALEYSQCIAKYPGLKRKVNTILAGLGSGILEAARQAGDDSITRAEDYAGQSYFDYAINQIRQEGAQNIEDLSEQDIVNMLPARALTEYNARFDH